MGRQGDGETRRSGATFQPSSLLSIPAGGTDVYSAVGLPCEKTSVPRAVLWKVDRPRVFKDLDRQGDGVDDVRNVNAASFPSFSVSTCSGATS